MSEQPHPFQPSQSDPATSAPPPYTPSRRLARSRDDRWLSGVCGGLAQYTGLDANLIRLVVVLGTVFGFGSLFVAYVVAWVLMPEG